MLTLTETASAVYSPPPAGTFPAVCVAVIDLGTQASTYDGQTRHARKLQLTFELCDPEARRDDGSAFTVAKRFTASLHERSGLRKFTESWRGAPFSPADLKGFDLRTLLGKPCLLGVVHEVKPDGKTFANIASVMRLPKGMPTPQPTQELIAFDLDAPDWRALAMLPSRLQETIAASPEFARANPPASASLGGKPAAAPAVPAPSPAAHGFEDMTDDVPW